MQGELEIDGVKMLVTVQDGEAIRAALLAYLRKSELAERAELINYFEHAQIWFGTDAPMNIGGWWLVAEDGHLRLKTRGPAGAGGAQGYVADLAKQGNTWQVEQVSPWFIHRRL